MTDNICGDLRQRLRELADDICYATFESACYFLEVGFG
jgi:hypothetical protein